MSIERSLVLQETHRQLMGVLSDGRPRSGTELARLLGLSRSGVWKAIQHLQELGMQIHAVRGVGYRLGHPLQLLDAASIEGMLSPEAAGLLGRVYLHEVLESTNTSLRQAAGEGAPSGSICLAEMQRLGRGRLGRTWQSPFAGNIYLSLLWRFSGPAVVEGLSLAIGTVLVRVLRAAGAEGVGLKWPNDLLWNDRKLGGILIEISGEMNGQCTAIIGIGINCFVPERCAASIDQPAVDLRRIPGVRSVSRNRLVGEILNQLLPAIAEFEMRGFRAYVEEWSRYHAWQGRAVRLELPTGTIEGRVVGVTSGGALLLELGDGSHHEFSSGDVRLRAADP